MRLPPPGFTSVVSGGLPFELPIALGVLAAAGLLKGYRSACHWAARDSLKAFGAIPVAERVVTKTRGSAPCPPPPGTADW